MANLEARAHNLFEPKESTKEGANKSAITIGSKWENAETMDRYSFTLFNSHVLN